MRVWWLEDDEFHLRRSCNDIRIFSVLSSIRRLCSTHRCFLVRCTACVVAVSCTEGATPTDETDRVGVDVAAAAVVFSTMDDEDNDTGADINAIAGPDTAVDVAFSIPDSPIALPTPDAHNTKSVSRMLHKFQRPFVPAFA